MNEVTGVKEDSVSLESLQSAEQGGNSLGRHEKGRDGK